MSTLKPCPFCGGKASMHCDDPVYKSNLYFVMCDDCLCSTDLFLEAEAAEKWNRRSDYDPSDFAPYFAMHKLMGEVFDRLDEISSEMMNIAAQSMSTEDYVKLARGVYDGECEEDSDEEPSEVSDE